MSRGCVWRWHLYSAMSRRCELYSTLPLQVVRIQGCNNGPRVLWLGAVDYVIPDCGVCVLLVLSMMERGDEIVLDGEYRGIG